MILKAEYKLEYTVNKDPDELIVYVELKPFKGILEQFQPIYDGNVSINNIIDNSYDLRGCVNAKFMAEEIGFKLRDDLKNRLIKEKKNFKLIKERLK